MDLKKKKETSKICCKNYYEKNKEYIIEQNKEYHEKHKEFFIEYQKQYREKNKEKIQERYENNKEKINKQRKNYYEKNKDHYREKHKCGCGGCYTTDNKSQHNKTKKHLKYIQENESN